MQNPQKKIDYAVLIKSAMIEKGFNYKTLAQLVSVNNRAIWGWESGEYCPTFRNYEKLIEALGDEFGKKLKALDERYGRIDFATYEINMMERMKQQAEEAKKAEEEAKKPEETRKDPDPAPQPAPQKPEPEQKRQRVGRDGHHANGG